RERSGAGFCGCAAADEATSATNISALRIERTAIAMTYSPVLLEFSGRRRSERGHGRVRRRDDGHALEIPGGRVARRLSVALDLEVISGEAVPARSPHRRLRLAVELTARPSRVLVDRRTGDRHVEGFLRRRQHG